MIQRTPSTNNRLTPVPSAFMYRVIFKNDFMFHISLAGSCCSFLIWPVISDPGPSPSLLSLGSLWPVVAEPFLIGTCVQKPCLWKDRTIGKRYYNLEQYCPWMRCLYIYNHETCSIRPFGTQTLKTKFVWGFFCLLRNYREIAKNLWHQYKFQ